MKENKKNRPPTIEDIAKIAGCSKNTVSLALRNSPRISPLTRKKIHAIAEELGYIPNISARNLITKKSGIIGIYTRSLYDAVRVELVHTLFDELHTAEYRPVLGLGDEEIQSWHQSPWLNTFTALNVEALAVIGESIGELPYLSTRTPTIFVGCFPVDDVKADYVALDRKEGARKAVQYLKSQGSREVLLACDPAIEFGVGCIKSCKEAGIKCTNIKAKYPYGEEWENEIFSFYKNTASPPRSIIFGDTPFGVRVMHDGLKKRVTALTKAEAVSYDYFPWTDALKIPITTIEQPIEELSRTSVQLIKKRL